MAAFVLTMVLSVIVGGVAWLALGNRFQLNEDPRQNEIANILLYCAIVFPVAFIVVFFGMERL